MRTILNICFHSCAIISNIGYIKFYRNLCGGKTAAALHRHTADAAGSSWAFYSCASYTNDIESKNNNIMIGPHKVPVVFIILLCCVTSVSVVIIPVSALFVINRIRYGARSKQTASERAYYYSPDRPRSPRNPENNYIGHLNNLIIPFH